jgi:hypothetical protein
MSLKKFLAALKKTSQEMIDNHDYIRLEREDLMGELCHHLHAIGVDAVILNPSDPEAYRYPPYVLGCSKLTSRNTDMILIQCESSGGSSGDEDGPDETFAIYRYFYVVRANVDDLENSLKADFKSNWHDRCCKKRDFKLIDINTLEDKEVYDYGWEGGELARRLNADTDLTKAMYSGGLDRLEVRPDKKRRCVRIEHWHYKPYGSKDVLAGDLKDVYEPRLGDTYLTTAGRKQFPSREAFEAFERIAYSVRKIVLTSPLNSSLEV